MAPGGGGAAMLVLAHQSVSAEEEEDGHAIVAKEREQVDRQTAIRVAEHLMEDIHVVLVVGVLVLLDNRPEPVAVVVQDYAQDGQAPQDVALGAREQLLTVIVGSVHVSVI